MSVRPAHWVALALVAGVALAADQATKALVRSSLALGQADAGFGPFSLLHVRNSGILGGRLAGTALVMGIVTTFVVAGILVFFARSRSIRPAMLVALGLLVGGSLGNLVDRLRLGYVTDFITRDGEKAFNLADVSIFVGIAVVAVLFLLGRRSPEPGATADESP